MKNIEEIFQERTCYNFSNKPVDAKILAEIYDLMKLGPTSANSCPLRILFIQSSKAKEKLIKCVAKSNITKIESAPIVAIFAYDTKFYTKMDKLFPHSPVMKATFESNSHIALETAIRNSSLQAAYFMIIARSKGLDCGPMSGFNSEMLNDSFFLNSDYRVNFICNLGYKAEDNTYPRLPRLDFNECCEII